MSNALSHEEAEFPRGGVEAERAECGATVRSSFRCAQSADRTESTRIGELASPPPKAEELLARVAAEVKDGDA